MINARFMYARPGNLFKEFIIEDNSQQVSSTGRVVNKHSGNGTKTLKGCLANATDKDIENHSIQDHIVTHTIVQSGPPKAKRTDRLILGERSFYICDVDEVCTGIPFYSPLCQIGVSSSRSFEVVKMNNLLNG